MSFRFLWTAAVCLAPLQAAAAADARTDRWGDPLPDGVAARMGTLRCRHGDAVWFVGFLADRKTIVSIGKDDSLRLWEASSGKAIGRYGSDAVLGCASLSADRRILAVRVGDDVVVWDARTIRPLVKLDKPDIKLAGVACSADGRWIATCGSRIRVWDAGAGAWIRDLAGAAESFTAAVFYPDGKTLVSVGHDGVIRWWDVQSGQVVHEAEGPKGGVSLVEISPDGKRLATYGMDNTLRLWDATERAEQHSFLASSLGEQVNCFAFSPNGKQLAAGCWDGAIRLYDAEAGRELRRGEGCQGPCNAVAFSPDGAMLVSGGLDGAVRQWDAATGKEVRPFAGPCGQVRALAVSPDGTTVASAGIDRRVHLWNAADGAARPSMAAGDGDQVAHLAFAADGRTLVGVSRGAREVVHVWDAANGKELRAFSPSDKGYGEAFAVSPDGSVVAASGGPERIALFDAAKGEMLREHVEADGSLQPGPFLDGGRTLAMFHHAHGVFSRIDGLFLWDTATGGFDLRPVHSEAGFVCGMAGGPDAKTLVACGSDRMLRIWNASTGDLVRWWDAGKDYILATAISSDGRTIATAELDGSISVWETVTGLRRGLLRGDQGFVDVLAFSPHGDRLYSGGHDGTVLAWDLTGHSGPIAPRLAGDFGRAPAPRAPGDSRSESPTSLDRLWDDLATGDAAVAYRAVWALAAAPERSAPYLKKRLTRAAATPNQMVQWIADLDDDDFLIRERASAALRTLDETAEAALLGARAGEPSAEARRRIEELLEWAHRARIGMHPPEPCVVRALEALEDAATPEAREALAALADGPATSMAREARASLERLRRHTAP